MVSILTVVFWMASLFSGADRDQAGPAVRMSACRWNGNSCAVHVRHQHRHPSLTD